MSNDHIADQEDANTRACRSAALLAGKTAEQADNCDDGEHGCQYCPWRQPADAACSRRGCPEPKGCGPCGQCDSRY